MSETNSCTPTFITVFKEEVPNMILTQHVWIEQNKNSAIHSEALSLFYGAHPQSKELSPTALTQVIHK
jgi:hypothetical protein